MENGTIGKSAREINSPEHQKRSINETVDSLLRDLAKLDPESMTISRKQFEREIAKIVELVDRYFTVVGLDFLVGSEDHLNFQFPKNWHADWMKSLEPRIAVEEKRLERYEQFVETALSMDTRAKSIVGEFSGTVMDLRTYHQQLGFYLGVFVGAKMMGASLERLHQMGKRLVELERGAR